MNEIRVYAITNYNSFNDIIHLSDDEFIDEAKKDGLIWTLSGFETEFNNGTISDEWIIRII